MNLNKYQIERRYIRVRDNTRPGVRLTSGKPVFFVAHDTGNEGATADDHFEYFNTQTERDASAQVFTDDKKILEIIPTGTGPDPAEKAWHVIYNATEDNRIFGDDANDIALGIELCYGGDINFAEAYKRFVWYFAFCCYTFNRPPDKSITTHKRLDPLRKVDCDHALARGGLTFDQFLLDVVRELGEDEYMLNEGVAETIINTWMKKSWEEAMQKGDKAGAHYINWLANELRKAAGLSIE